MTRVSNADESEIVNAVGRFFALLLMPQTGPPSVPGTNLPDLDLARGTQTQEPQAPPSSTEACEDCDPCPMCNVNHPPVAIIGGPYDGFANQAISLNGSQSMDPDGDTITLRWNFGDGSNANNATPQHAYVVPGTYTVTLTVTDSHNATASASTTATITAAPTPTPTPSPNGSANAAAFISQSVPTTMTAGSTYPVSVTMRNTGGTTWTAAHLYRLGSLSPQDNTTWGAARVYLPADVPPGAQATFNFTVSAPPGSQCGGRGRNGTHYGFQWRMVQDGVGWFGDSSTNTDVRSCSSITPIPVYTPDNHYSARLEPRNRTGSPGDDLLSRNFNWTMNVLSLPGRSRLNLNLPLTYNSLAWTRVQSAFIFDADRGFPSPGFHLGFPTIQGPFTNTQAGHHSYLMITAAGGHVELREASSGVYESVDSSYLRLIDSGGAGLLLTDASGSQMTYLLINGEYHCTSIKDANGNFISIRYDPTKDSDNLGLITSIVDTLGRTIKFNYDNKHHLRSITQEWSSGTHVWATFSYKDVEVTPNFVAEDNTAASISGLPEKGVISALTQVGLDDGSHYNFDYTSWGQVYQIHYYAADNHELSRTSYDMPLDGYYPRTECPRFTERHNWAENWNSGYEAITSYTNGTQTIGGQTVPWCQATSPDGTKYREYATIDYDDWHRGLVTRSEIYSAENSTVPKKTTVTDWIQDLTNVGYQLNPRISAKTISDSEGNRNRTTYEYAGFGLPFDVFEWGPSGSSGWTLLRRTHTDYETGAAYVMRHIIGLPKQLFLFSNEDNEQRLYAKVSYEYDAGGAFLADQGEPLQHDGPNYGGSLVQGRGLLTGVRRWDVNHETDINFTTGSSSGYNTAGSLVFSRDALNHQTSISYLDSFSDGINHNTLAHPTQITIDGSTPINSYIQYNYDFSARTRLQGPPPQGQTQGAIQTFSYDSAQRLTRVATVNNGAYTRFVYPPSQTIINQFSTINDVSTEAYSATVFDGAKRVRATASDFPNSTGHYSGKFVLFDVMGRAIQQTNPTEMNHAWTATGDDAAGWYSVSQTYDWKGRPLITTNQDSATRIASYGGCGCAGGAVVTLQDEGAIIEGVLKRRTERIYNDALGRTARAEVLNWDGSVYATTSNTYNARDDLTLVRQWSGAENGTGPHQDTTMTYDGYGRLKTRHVPEQQADPNNAASTDHVTYNYNPDDTMSSVTDARGASAIYSYNNRGLMTGISFSAPAGITPTSSVTFGYDSAGNTTSMSDGLGSASYSYDELSRMISETRSYNNVGSYTLNYGYNVAGELTSISDPWGEALTYAFDPIGQLTGVTASGYLYSGQLLGNTQYRAGGTLESETYGDGFTTREGYNPRLQVTTFEVKNSAGVQQMSGTYQYQANGALRFSHNALDERFDRAFDYDHLARTIQAYSGSEARDFISGTQTTTPTGPYRQSYQYDAFDEITQHANRLWREPETVTSLYNNNRNSLWTYDADGRVLHDDKVTYTLDAAGQLIGAAAGGSTNTDKYDGKGRLVSRSLTTLFRNRPRTQTTYYLNSTVLGGLAVAELVATGQKTRSYIYANGRKLAESTAAIFKWAHEDPVTASRSDSTPDGHFIGKAEYNADGVNTGFIDPTTLEEAVVPEPTMYDALLSFGSDCSVADPTCQTCYVDGLEQSCGRINWESVQQCPNNDCGPRLAPDHNGNPVLTPLTTNPNTGELGYWPNGPTGPGLVYGPMGDAHFVSVSADGHSEVAMGWVFDELVGHLVFVPIPTSYSGYDYFATEATGRFGSTDPCTHAIEGIATGVVKQGANLLLKEGRRADLTAEQMAYVFASAHHETDQGKSMVEYASGMAYEGRADLGNTLKGDGPLFRGRGFVQLTGRKNYQRYSKLLGVDLEAHPDLAADPANSAFITVDGMKNGVFTGMSLSHYINHKTTDFYHARAVVNGDTAKNGQRIAGYAGNYLKALQGCQFGPVAHRIR